MKENEKKEVTMNELRRKNELIHLKRTKRL